MVSLGHAAFFGLGAYAAGLFSKFVWGEPISGLCCRRDRAGDRRLATSFIIARFRHLALIMITLGLGLLLQKSPIAPSWLTGGIDGLQGVRFGRCSAYSISIFTAIPPTAYALVVLFVIFLSRGGSSIRRSAWRCAASAKTEVRMPAIGAPSRAHIRTVYTIAAAIAGIAGALLAQTTQTRRRSNR